jgi:DNA-3-methyladenine glycosylase II
MNKPIRSIPTADNFSFQECLWFLNRNFDDCMHATGTDFIRKALLVGEEPILFEIRNEDHHLQIQILSGSCTESTEHGIIQFVKEWLEPTHNLDPFYKLLQNTPKVAYMTSRYAGLRLVGIPDLFEALTWSIIGQQINLTFAYKLKRRLVEKYGSSIHYEGADYHIFPSYAILANATVSELREMQFSEKKAEYVIGLAKVFANGEMSKELLVSIPSLAEKQKALTAIRGIGIWTANYALMKSLKEPSSIPHGDAGLLNALIRHGIIEQKTDTAVIADFFSKFKGWENYLVFYLWRSLAPTLSEKEINSVHREK